MEDNQLVFVCGTLVLGGVLTFLGYYLASSKRRCLLAAKRHSETNKKNVTDSDEKKQSEQRELIPRAGATSGGGNSKRQAKSKKRREAQQEFSHSWMVGALKGHTAPILDMDFSANGKFLASSAEDCGLMPSKKELARDLELADAVTDVPASGIATSATKAARSAGVDGSKPVESAPLASSADDVVAPPSPSSSTKSNSSVNSSSGKEEHQRAILSRRQRKNRARAPRRELCEREEDLEDDHNGPPLPVSSLSQPATTPRHRGHHHRNQDSPTRSPDGAAGADAAAVAAAAAAANTPGPNTSKSFSKEPKKSAASAQSLAASRSPAPVGPAEHKKPKSHHYHHYYHDHYYQHGGVTAHVNMPVQLQHLSDVALASMLRRYALTGDQLAHLGYPMELSDFSGYAVVINYQQHPLSLRAHHRQHFQQRHGQQHHLDVNAREFVPGSWSNSVESSDLEQESSSDSDKCSDIGEAAPLAGFDLQQSQESGELADPRLNDAIERLCARCYKSFLMTEDHEYLFEDKCVYHWGKLRSAPGGIEYWECCRGREYARGCTTVPNHVWTGIVPGINGPFYDYVRTRPTSHVKHDTDYGAYALDCEMFFTKRGLELGKVTVVALDGTVVYETLVKPDVEVIDYNTKFSGLRAKDVAKATKTLRDVQRDITKFVFAETLLIGHGLENDLRALRLLHTTVVDTCVAYPHFLGYPFRSSLKTLARTVLKKEIQIKEHDSAEDARIVVDLMLHRLRHDFY